MTSISKDFVAAMRRFPASVAIIAAGKAPDRRGMTATAVCSLTASPPQMLVCMNAQTGTFSALQEAGVFSTNVLHCAQRDLAARFASNDPALRGDAKFDSSLWRDDEQGAPVLINASQSIVCRLNTCFEASTHMIVVGSVLAISSQSQEPALLYENGQFGSFQSESVAQTA